MLSGSYLRLQTQLPCKNFALSNKDVNKEAVNEIMIMWRIVIKKFKANNYGLTWTQNNSENKFQNLATSYKNFLKENWDSWIFGHVVQKKYIIYTSTQETVYSARNSIGSNSRTYLRIRGFGL